MGKKAVFKLFYFISIILTLVIVGITVIGTFTIGISPEKSKAIGILTLALPLLLGVNIFLFIYWAIRLRYWVWFPLIAIACNWSLLTTFYQFSSHGEKELLDETCFKIATYNVANFGKEASGYSCKRIAEYMTAEQADIICIQEFSQYGAFTVDSIHATFKDWPYHVLPKTKEANILQLAVYSKYPITESKLIVYPGTQNCSMWCDIVIDKKTIRVFNNHLQTTNVTQSRSVYEKQIQEQGLGIEADFALNTENLILRNEVKRAQQADFISKSIQESPYPVLLCGDFNSIPSSYTYHSMTKSGLKDGFKSAGKGYMYTYRYFKRLLRIDYIFHSPSIRISDYYSPDLDLTSDHNPVFMQFKLP